MACNSFCICACVNQHHDVTSFFDDVISNNIMADDAFALMREEIYAYIKIESRHGKKATEIFNALQEVDPTCAVGFSTICRWVRDFNNGCQESYKKPSSGRPVTVTNADNNEIVAQLLNSDR